MAAGLCLLLSVPASAQANPQHDTLLRTIGNRPAWRVGSSATPLSIRLSPSLSVLMQPRPMPFFCRIEHRWSERHALPLKFRLGSVPYVDGLEGKRRWYE